MRAVLAADVVRVPQKRVDGRVLKIGCGRQLEKYAMSKPRLSASCDRNLRISGNVANHASVSSDFTGLQIHAIADFGVATQPVIAEATRFAEVDGFGLLPSLPVTSLSGLLPICRRHCPVQVATLVDERGHLRFGAELGDHHLRQRGHFQRLIVRAEIKLGRARVRNTTGYDRRGAGFAG